MALSTVRVGEGKMAAYLCQVMCGSEEEATRIARVAVGEGLAAAANILGPATSVFRWRGEPRTATEVVLLMKTVERRRRALIARVAELHAYACPSIIVMPITDGHPGYLAWLDEAVAPL